MSRNAHVSHPVLHLDVLGPDGRASSDHRVFCRYQQRSVSVGTCNACVHRDRITAGPSRSIECTFPVPDAEPPPDETGDRTPVGMVLVRGTAALGPSTRLGDALAALRALDCRSIAVVDAEHALVGVIHEAFFVASQDVPPTAATEHEVVGAMSSALAIHESVPIRDALRILASAHLREATVVDDARVPLGTFRDVEGLRWVARARSTLPPPPEEIS